MSDDIPEPHELDDDRLAIALNEYYRRVAEQVAVDREAFLHEYADVAGEIRGHFETIDDLGLLARQQGARESHIGSPISTVRYFGNYELLEEIGRGGMGVVYRARQVNLKRVVAVKMILAAQLASDEDIIRFRQEAEAAAALSHPNIVTIFEVGEHEGQHFFSMDYVEGMTLAQLVRENTINPRRAAEYVQTIAIAIGATHDAGVLHRDLKPSNVMIDGKTSELRITDFGLSKRLNSETAYTSTGRVLGTPSYMAPEQALGKSDQVGPATDIYSIGAVLYELVTARPPFVGETAWDIVWQVKNAEPVKPSSLVRRLPKDLETICLKCLQKDPLRRYSTAQELANDVGRFLRGEAILARPVSRAERMWQWCKRNPALASALSAAAVGFVSLLITLVAFGLTQRKSAQRLTAALSKTQEREREVKFRLAEAERDKGLQLCRDGEPAHGVLWLIESLKTAPHDADDLHWSIRVNLNAWKRELIELQEIFPREGQTLGFSRSLDRFVTCGARLATVRELPTGKPIGAPLPHEAGIRAAEFTSDGSAVLLRSGSSYEQKSELRLWREEDGRWDEKRIKDPGFTVLGHRFLPNDSLLVAAVSNDGTQVWDVLNEKPLGKPLAHEFSNSGIGEISPDGKYAVTRPSREQAQIWTVESGQALGGPLVHPELVNLALFSPDSKLILTTSTAAVGANEREPRAQVWDLSTGKSLIGPLAHPGDAGDIRLAAFSADGERIFTQTHYSIRIWDRIGRAIGEPVPAYIQGKRLEISDNGRLLAFFDPSRGAGVWNVDADRRIGQSLGESPEIAISPNGHYLLTGNSDEARLWKLPQRGQRLEPLRHSEVDPDQLLAYFSADGKRLVSYGFRDMSARIWNVLTGKQLGPTIKSAEGIAHCALSPDNHWLATVSLQHFGRPGYRGLMLWDTATGERAERNLPRFENFGHSVMFTSDGRLLIAGGDNGTIHVYDMANDKVVGPPFQHPMPSYEGNQVTLALSHDNKTLASVVPSRDVIVLWDLVQQKKLDELRPPEGNIKEIKFSSDGEMLASAGSSTCLWQIRVSAPAKQLPVIFRESISVAISPDKKRLATGHSDGSAQLWNIASGEPLGLPLEHPRMVYQMNFALGGRLLVAGTPTGAQLWDCLSGVRVGPMLAPSTYIAASPDAKTIATAAEREVRLWDVPFPTPDDAPSASRQVERLTGLKLAEKRRAIHLNESEWRQLQP